jgi:hypothetical protein
MGIRMKKTIFLIIFTCVLLFTCENQLVDLSLPKTDTSQFITENAVYFPKTTKAIDVYNTVASLYSDNDYHSVNGNWKWIETTQVDGLTNQTWETTVFTKIKHIQTENKTHPNNSGLVYTHTVFLYVNDFNIREIIYQWQSFNGNTQKTELKNDLIDVDITFTF